MKEVRIPYVDSQFCCPTRERVHRLCELSITDYLLNKYSDLRERGGFIEGALVALLADESLSNGGSEEDAYLDILGWFDRAPLTTTRLALLDESRPIDQRSPGRAALPHRKTLLQTRLHAPRNSI